MDMSVEAIQAIEVLARRASGIERCQVDNHPTGRRIYLYPDGTHEIMTPHPNVRVFTTNTISGLVEFAKNALPVTGNRDGAMPLIVYNERSATLYFDSQDCEERVTLNFEFSYEYEWLLGCLNSPKILTTDEVSDLFSTRLRQIVGTERLSSFLQQTAYLKVITKRDEERKRTATSSFSGGIETVDVVGENGRPILDAEQRFRVRPYAGCEIGTQLLLTCWVRPDLTMPNHWSFILDNASHEDFVGLSRDIVGNSIKRVAGELNLEIQIEQAEAEQPAVARKSIRGIEQRGEE